MVYSKRWEAFSDSSLSRQCACLADSIIPGAGMLWWGIVSGLGRTVLGLQGRRKAGSTTTPHTALCRGRWHGTTR